MEPHSRHGSCPGRPHLFPGQRSRRRNHCPHRPPRAALCLHLSSRHRRRRQPSLYRRHRLRHHHRRHHRHGREHLPRAQPPPRPGLQAQRCHPCCCTRCRPPHFLFRRRHHRGVPSYLRAHRSRRQAVPSH